MATLSSDPGLPSVLLLADRHLLEILLDSSLRLHLSSCHLFGKILE